MIFLIPVVSMAQTAEATWNYPVHPGTDEWKQLNTFTERFNALNVPDDILTEMTTENLVKTCLKYPWWILITSRDDNQDGYDFLKSVFNGFRELEKRKDAGIELLKVYEKMMPEDIYQYKTLVKQGMLCFEFTYIEMLLSQSSILRNIENENLVSIVQRASYVYKAKSEAFDKYSYYGIATSCLILIRALEIRKYDEYKLLSDNLPELIIFNKRGNSTNKELLDRIHFEANNLLNK